MCNSEGVGRDFNAVTRLEVLVGRVFSKRPGCLSRSWCEYKSQMIRTGLVFLQIDYKLAPAFCCLFKLVDWECVKEFVSNNQRTFA